MIQLLAVTLNPTSGFASGELQRLANELAGSVLILCVIGWVVGAGVKALASNGGNQVMADRGGSWMSRAFIAAVAVAAGAVVINFAITIGNAIH